MNMTLSAACKAAATCATMRRQGGQYIAIVARTDGLRVESTPTTRARAAETVRVARVTKALDLLGMDPDAAYYLACSGWHTGRWQDEVREIVEAR